MLLHRRQRRDSLEPLLGVRGLRLGGDGVGGDAQLLLLAVGFPARGFSGFIVVEGVLVVVVALDLSFGARLAGFIVLLASCALGAGLGLLAGLTVAGMMGWRWGARRVQRRAALRGAGEEGEIGSGRRSNRALIGFIRRRDCGKLVGGGANWAGGAYPSSAFLRLAPGPGPLPPVLCGALSASPRLRCWNLMRFRHLSLSCTPVRPLRRGRVGKKEEGKKVSGRCLAGRSCGGGQFVGGATRERRETALDRVATPVPSPGGVFDRSEVVGRRAPTPARDATPPTAILAAHCGTRPV